MMKTIAVYIRIPKSDEGKLETIYNEYRNKIAKRKDCRLAAIYCDIGLSGFDNTRPGYLRMLQAARNKEFEYIVTKHCGKLNRGAVELHKIVRELQQIGVGIYFEDEKADTLKIEDLFYMTKFLSLK